MVGSNIQREIRRLFWPVLGVVQSDGRGGGRKGKSEPQFDPGVSYKRASLHLIVLTTVHEAECINPKAAIIKIKGGQSRSCASHGIFLWLLVPLGVCHI